MQPNQFSDKLKNFSAKLSTELPLINEKVAMNTYALIHDRIPNEGIKGDGTSLGTYSDNELPAFFFTGKSLNKSGEAAVEKAKKKGKGLSYKEFREANNRPTDHVTLSFSGQMLNDIGVIKQVVDDVKIITSVGAKNTKARSGNLTTDDIVGFNKDRYGDFLTVTPDEEKAVAITYDTLLQEFIDKNFG